MRIKHYEIMEHTETTSPYRWVVWWVLDGKTERARHLGRRGGFLTLEAAVDAVNRRLKEEDTR